jgi:hypothetical protein
MTTQMVTTTIPMHVATDLAPALTMQSAAIAQNLIPFSGWLNAAMRTLHVAHFYSFCMYNHERIQASMPQFLASSALFAANVTVIREIARLVLAARIVNRCRTDGKELLEKLNKVKTVARCSFPISTHYIREKGKLDAANPAVKQHLASKLSFLPKMLLTPILKAEQLAVASGRLLSGCFWFMPNLLAIGQLLAFDRFTELSAYTGMSDNFQALFEELNGNRKALSQEIEKNREALSQVLQATSSTHTVDQLYELVAKAKMPDRLIRQTQEVIVDSAVTVVFASTGILARPLSSHQRKVEQVPLSATRFKRYSYDDLSFIATTCKTLKRL